MHDPVNMYSKELDHGTLRGERQHKEHWLVISVIQSKCAVKGAGREYSWKLKCCVSI